MIENVLLPYSNDERVFMYTAGLPENALHGKLILFPLSYDRKNPSAWCVLDVSEFIGEQYEFGLTYSVVENSLCTMAQSAKQISKCMSNPRWIRNLKHKLESTKIMKIFDTREEALLNTSFAGKIEDLMKCRTLQLHRALLATVIAAGNVVSLHAFEYNELLDVIAFHNGEMMLKVLSNIKK